MREVLIHLNVEVDESLDDDAARQVAVDEAIAAAKISRESFLELVALVDAT